MWHRLWLVEVEEALWRAAPGVAIPYCTLGEQAVRGDALDSEGSSGRPSVHGRAAGRRECARY